MHQKSPKAVYMIIGSLGPKALKIMSPLRVKAEVKRSGMESFRGVEFRVDSPCFFWFVRVLGFGV